MQTRSSAEAIPPGSTSLYERAGWDTSSLPATVDAFDVWLELVAKDDAGRTIFWSGMREDGGEGPVESSAHFYRTLLIDEHGNPIDKRNAWAARAVVYVNLIPPGAADTVHFRLDIPEDVGDEIQILARLNYRKFSWFNTQFAYAGVRSGYMVYRSITMKSSVEDFICPGINQRPWIKNDYLLPIILLDLSRSSNCVRATG